MRPTAADLAGNGPRSGDLIFAVRALRATTGDSQQAFATRLGLSIRAIANYEKDRQPTGKALVGLMNLADAYEKPQLAAVFQRALSEELDCPIPRLGAPELGEVSREHLPDLIALKGALTLAAAGSSEHRTMVDEVRKILRPFYEMQNRVEAARVAAVAPSWGSWQITPLPNARYEVRCFPGESLVPSATLHIAFDSRNDSWTVEEDPQHQAFRNRDDALNLAQVIGGDRLASACSEASSLRPPTS